MKALVFAAGLGTRLKPFTESHPKALVDIGGKPMLRRVIDRLTETGVENIIVNVHHHAAQIVDYLENERDNIPAEIYISDESDRLLDTGGGILHARALLDNNDNEPFIVHNADILSTVNLSEMMERHHRSGADVTLLSADRPTSRKLLFDTEGRMHGWTNVNTEEVKYGPSYNRLHTPECNLIPLAFGGIHIMSPKIFPLLEDYAKEDNKFPIVPFYIRNTLTLNIRAYCPPADSYTWYDIGKPETLEKARSWLAGHNIHFL